MPGLLARGMIVRVSAHRPSFCTRIWRLVKRWPDRHRKIGQHRSPFSYRLLVPVSQCCKVAIEGEEALGQRPLLGWELVVAERWVQGVVTRVRFPNVCSNPSRSAICVSIL